MEKRPFLSLLTCILLLLTGCGGSGGSPFVGAGRVVLTVEPQNIDVGDRTRILLEISEVNEDGIIVKIRYPGGLSYVPETAFLIVDNLDIDTGPDVQAVNKRGDHFLVFFFPKSLFSKNNKGTLELEFEGNEVVRSGMFEVDLDVDDPDILNKNEFDPDNPEFQQEEAESIEVED